ncbi:MAG TPA: tryptophan--tRNA ligase [Chitinophagales bacterium]|jgi:tryptophanyl-tRNA synthetase|nr:tryptophan--tRNA ligase [Chitinophagales bacterium]HQV78848.1 tryptophan--tRNA ligase [Chitinophagales bacterium]HQW79214.1 tryptophan--tRNA ligase [Chitinophagales bacterium]HRB67949.1 tryptophan--tRNA ligase [Chitinophagales bacterium]
MKERVLSGVRSTGNLHLGNYFGALKNFIQMQENYEAYFFIANLHALTTHPNPELLKKSVRATLVEYIACGLDPEKSSIYVQSDVPEISELYTLLNMFAYKGELEKCTSFKEKIKKHQENINAGLLTYPVLMAADILIHRAHKVPVGKDQEQHLEMTRNFAVRFNHLFNVDYFPEPTAFDMTGKLVKVPGLDGTGKMGKSEGEGNAIFLREDAESIRKKVMRAKTDSGPTVPNQTKSEEIQNIFTLMHLVSTPDTIQHFEESYNNCSIRYGELKKQLAEDIITFTTPLREKINALENDNAYINKMAKDGAEKARISARKTLDDVQEIMGLKPIWK